MWSRQKPSEKRFAKALLTAACLFAAPAMAADARPEWLPEGALGTGLPMLADPGGFAVDALAAAQQNAEDIWIEKLRLDTRDLAQASGEDLAGVDLDALLAGGDAETLLRRLTEDMEMLRSKSSGAGLALDLEDAPALMAEARALLLERAAHGEDR